MNGIECLFGDVYNVRGIVVGAGDQRHKAKGRKNGRGQRQNDRKEDAQLACAVQIRRLKQRLGQALEERPEYHGVPRAAGDAGQNVDPVSLLKLTEELKRRSGEKDNYKVTLLVISKSGTTIEPTTAFHVLMKELSGFCDVSVIAVTDAEK